MPTYATKMCCLLVFLPVAGMAQQVLAPPAATWSSGAGVGNGVELHVGYLKPHLMTWVRGRGKWWGPEKGPGADFFGSEINTKSRQFEVAALAGYPLAVGRSTFYAATGAAFVAGRKLGEYRFTTRTSGGLAADPTHYYAYRDYTALGLPLEIGYLSPPFNAGYLRLGASAQANLNPQQSVYCLFFTVWYSSKPTL